VESLEVIVDEYDLFIAVLVNLGFEIIEEFEGVSGHHPWRSPVPFG